MGDVSVAVIFMSVDRLHPLSNRYAVAARPAVFFVSDLQRQLCSTPLRRNHKAEKTETATGEKKNFNEE